MTGRCDDILCPQSTDRDSREWLVRTTEEIRLAPRGKQLIAGMIELPKRRFKPDLVYIEPAHIPLEEVKVMAADHYLS
jgi:hypothetical protein